MKAIISRAALASIILLSPLVVQAAVEFNKNDASSASSFRNFSMVSRVYAPYGLDKLEANSTTYGYAYGMGALEQIAYDYQQKYVYGMSEQGYITVIDVSDSKNLFVLPEEYMVSVDGDTLTSVVVCPDMQLLFASRLTNGPGQIGDVLVYSILQRNTSTNLPSNKVELLKTIEVGYHPDNIAAGPGCSMLAVANEGEGTYDEATGLNDPVGSITLIDVESLTATNVPLDKWTDTELIAKGVHLPLSLNAMKYWDEVSSISNETNFTNAIANYQTAMNLEPEYVAWSADGRFIYVSLQESSALVTVDVDAKEAMSIQSYGLKDWGTVPIDIWEDGGCSMMTTIPGFYSLPMPDSIALVVVDGVSYLLVAEEGDDKAYGLYEERVKMADLVAGDVVSGVVPEFYCSQSPDLCSSDARVTVGTAGVDYETDYQNPVITNIVAFGGRGIAIYQLPDSPSNTSSFAKVWESGDDLEAEGCAAFPWSHNSIQDEEFSPIYDVLYNTTADEDLKTAIEDMNNPEEDGCSDQGNGTPGACPLGQTVDARSQKDGPAPEAIVVGEACGRLYAVTAGEKNGIGYLYDISEISAPELVKVFHLSPESENLSAGVAYMRVLGEVDSEGVIFLEASRSPSGKPGVFFGGAWSGTLSFWEFECADDAASTTAADVVTANGTETLASDSTSNTAVNGGKRATFVLGVFASLYICFVQF